MSNKLSNLSNKQLTELHQTFEAEFQKEKLARATRAEVSIDLTRGKPSAQQLDLSNNLLEAYSVKDLQEYQGMDPRNYGGLDGVPEAKSLFAPLLGANPSELIVFGNSSLELMYLCIHFYFQFGGQKVTPWSKEGSVKFICIAPGYDRHFQITEKFGFELVTVGFNQDGPDMDAIEALVASDKSIKGIWCVPKYSNPTGHVYSEEVIKRFAKLPRVACQNFKIFWDNAYAVHDFEDTSFEIPSLLTLCKQEGTQDSVIMFASTSKITFAGAGVCAVAASDTTRNELIAHLGALSIGPDKINQLRHVKFFGSYSSLQIHMRNHAKIIAHKFNLVLATLDEKLSDYDWAVWTKPRGGYFVSFDTKPGLAKKVVSLANELGLKLTPAGATFPYGKDPKDSNIRLAPSFATSEEIKPAIEKLALSVKLATLAQMIQ
jgi:DNA-binding transcriptional MocR family regulator